MKKIISSLGFLAVLLLLGGASCISLSGGGATTTGPAGIFVSTDKGDSWQQMSLFPDPSGTKTITEASVYRLIPDPLDSKAMYWLTRGTGFFYTYDDGKSWRQPAEPMNSGFIYSATINPRDKCTIYATNGVIVYKTEDCSRSWQEVYRESQADRIVSVAFDPYKPDQIFLAKAAGDILKSVDFGKSWSAIARFGQRLEVLEMDPLQEGVIYIATRDSGLIRSEDGGATWETLEEGLEGFSGSTEFRRFYLHPKSPGVLYWISTYGILYSEDSGKTWAAMELINPPGSALIYAFTVNPRNDQEVYYTATINNRSTLYRSIDGGQNWTTKKLPTGQMPTVLRYHPDKDILYIGFTIPPKE